MIKITHDLLNIAHRLVEIDKDYHVFYNNTLDRFEVHNREHPGFLSLCFTASELDNRVLDTARRTRKENYDEIQDEIDKHNQEIEMHAASKVVQAQTKLADMLAYASSTSHDVIFTKKEEWQ